MQLAEDLWFICTDDGLVRPAEACHSSVLGAPVSPSSPQSGSPAGVLARRARSL